MAKQKDPQQEFIESLEVINKKQFLEKDCGIVANNSRLRFMTKEDFVFTEGDKELIKEGLEKHHEKIGKVINGEFLKTKE